MASVNVQEHAGHTGTASRTIQLQGRGSQAHTSPTPILGLGHTKYKGVYGGPV